MLGWASRVYFSDNGSTAIEIALKMAFRKFSFDHGINPDLLHDNSAKRCKLMVSIITLLCLLVFRLRNIHGIRKEEYYFASFTYNDM